MGLLAVVAGAVSVVIVARLLYRPPKRVPNTQASDPSSSASQATLKVVVVVVPILLLGWFVIARPSTTSFGYLVARGILLVTAVIVLTRFRRPN